MEIIRIRVAQTFQWASLNSSYQVKKLRDYVKKDRYTSELMGYLYGKPCTYGYPLYSLKFLTGGTQKYLSRSTMEALRPALEALEGRGVVFDATVEG